MYLVVLETLMILTGLENENAHKQPIYAPVRTKYFSCRL